LWEDFIAELVKICKVSKKYAIACWHTLADYKRHKPIEAAQEISKKLLIYNNDNTE